jgi:hypothetical protein
MIGKDYFKRQATTLRKMVEVAQDKTVAERLIHLADDFEAKADEPGGAADNPGARPFPGTPRRAG